MSSRRSYKHGFIVIQDQAAAAIMAVTAQMVRGQRILGYHSGLHPLLTDQISNASMAIRPQASPYKVMDTGESNAPQATIAGITLAASRIELDPASRGALAMQ